MNNQNQDVRMRGFQSRTSVDEAVRWVDEHSEKWSQQQAQGSRSEVVNLDAAHRRILASDIVSPIDVPAFDRSAMDGFALRSKETIGASDYNTLSFKVVGTVVPGTPFANAVKKGQAVRIMTGAPIPEGVDAVVPAEFARCEDDQVEISSPVASLKHIGRRAEDVASGSILFPSGHRLRPQDVGLIASIGFATVDVLQSPRIRLVITGNELAEPGHERTPYQIYEANSHILRGLIERDGGSLIERVRCQDNAQSIKTAIMAPGADAVLISGGSSVGSEDHAPGIVRDCGELAIHGIAMRPSSPTGIGRVGEAFVFLLPGNPVSCLCAYDFFAGRCIRHLAGLPKQWPYRQSSGILESKIVSQIGRLDYCRVRVVAGESIDQRIQPLALSGASILSSTTRATGFVVVPSELEGFAAGSRISFYEYGSG